ncbi:MAG: lipoyl(octanoyl) transferase LipB [Corynebacterium sp.]|nr:lipoyl(octanoyl) transferase LipB [Corynebacterium sp.]
MSTVRDPFFDPNLSIRASKDPIEVNFHGEVDYQKMWDMQAELAAKRAAGEIGDQLIFCTHPSIYTAGKRTQDSDRPTNGLPVIDVDRGGRITWHGPGQLVCYPIIKLAEPIDVVDYVRRLEEAIIHVIHDLGLVSAGRIDGRSGVWFTEPDRKVAALGIRVTQGVAMHGLAINCDNTLEYYDYIVPCGIDDAGVTTLSRELNRDCSVTELVEPLTVALTSALEGTLHVTDHSLGSAPNPCESKK